MESNPEPHGEELPVETPDTINLSALSDDPLRINEPEPCTGLRTNRFRPGKFLLPSPNYIVTPILLYLNLLVFIVMMVLGILIKPDVETMIKWGANFRPETLNGGWWRLISCCFIHFGILHFVTNMCALLFIGKRLEPVIGSAKFIICYTLTGIGASLASLYWHPVLASGGASGAIFGMFGVYLSILSAKFPKGNSGKLDLLIILLFLINTMVAGIMLNDSSILDIKIDNAAHIGGLVLGFLIGKVYFPSISDPDDRALFRNTSAGLIVGFLVLAFITYNTVIDQIGIYNEKMKRFSIVENLALEIYKTFEHNNLDKERMLYEINDRGIYYWNEAKDIVQEIKKLDLSDEMKQRNMSLERYCDLRIKTYELAHRSIAENTHQYDSQILEYNNKIEELIKSLSK